MPASPGDKFARPSSGTASVDAVAEWETRTYPGLARFAPPEPGALVLDDVLPEVEEVLGDPDRAAETFVDELGAAGLL